MNRLNLPKVNPVNVADRVANLLAESIVTGSLKAGTPLPEKTLSLETGVSRNTIRESLRILEHSGLVTRVPHKGAHVSQPTVSQIHSLYEARALLEIAAIHSDYSDELWDKVYAAYEHQTQAETSFDRVERDIEFHTSIIALANNSRIEIFYETLRQEHKFFLQAVMQADPNKETTQQSLEEHRKITEALRVRNIELAQRLILEHRAHHEARSIEIFKKLNEANRQS